MDEHILIVDDDRKLQELLADYLGGFGYQTAALYSAVELMSAVREKRPALVILDVMLPGLDGLEALKELRKESKVAVIMLTARGDETDRIVGLELGADDYLPKPFNPRELLARIKAILRRGAAADPQELDAESTGTSAAHPGRKPLRQVRSGSLEFDRVGRIIRVGEAQQELSAAEASLLDALLTHEDQTLSRDELMNLTRGRDFMGFERSIDVHISRIRAKLAELPGQAERVRTVWGTGYVWLSEDAKK